MLEGFPWLHADSVTGVAAGGLTLPDDLDDLASLEAEVEGDGVRALDTWQLGLLEPVALEQLGLLCGAEADVLGHELVVGDVDDERRLVEGLDGGWGDGGDQLQRAGGDAVLVDEDTRLVVLLLDVYDERLHGLDADAGLIAELDPHGSELRELGDGLLHGVGLEGHGLARGAAHRVEVLRLEVLERHVDLLLRHEVTTVPHHLLHRAERTPQPADISLVLLVHYRCCAVGKGTYCINTLLPCVFICCARDELAA